MKSPPFGDAALQPFGDPAVWCHAGRAATAVSDEDGPLRALTAQVLAASDLSLAAADIDAACATPTGAALLGHGPADALRPFAHLWRGVSLLQLNAGGGSATRLLATGASHVTALESGFARAQLCRARTRDLAHVEVVCAQAEELPMGARFDCVVALGSLDTLAPADAAAWLGHVRRWLKPNGTVVLGAHNALSPGYIAALTHEPALARLHWGEASLKELLLRAGLRGQRAYAAFPCLEAAQLILTEEGANAASETLAPLLCELRREPIATGPAVAQATRQLPAAVWPLIVRHGLALALAPAIILVGRAEPFAEGDDVLADGADLAYGYATQRPKALHKQSVLRLHNGHAEVVRRRLYPELPPAHGPLTQRLDDEAIPPGETLTERLRHALDTPGWSAASIARCLRPWADYVARHERHEQGAAGGATSSPEGSQGGFYDGHHDGRSPFAHPRTGRGVVAGHFIDVGPGNTALCGQGNVEAFALEWDLAHDVPLAWVLMRGVARALAAQTSVAPPAAEESIALGPLLQRVLAHWSVTVSHDELTSLCEQELRVFGTVPLSVERPTAASLGQPMGARDVLSQRLLVRHEPA